MNAQPAIIPHNFTWPSGQRDTLRNLKANATYTVEEGGKILSSQPFAR